MAGQLISSEAIIFPSPRPHPLIIPPPHLPDPGICAALPAELAQPPVTMGPALALARKMPRASLPFRSVNLRDAPGYDSGMQRHHLLPRQVLSAGCFGHMFDQIGRGRIGFDDFRSNGMLLPASDDSAVRIGLPLHRGPHRQYNALVLERVGQVEAGWSALRLRAPEIALDEALMRLGLLQAALRRRLLKPGRNRLSLNRFDPLGREADFAHLDAMVDALWPATETLAEGQGAEAPVSHAELALIQPGETDGAPDNPLFGAQLVRAAARSAFAF